MLKQAINKLFKMRRYEHLLRVPRQYANPVNVVDDDAALIMARSAARSPENVKALMAHYQVQKVEDLLDLLPDMRHRRNIARRLLSVMRAATGALPYNPDKRRNRLLYRKFFTRPDVHARIANAREFDRI
ncbi:MAG: hypothetical protein HZC41_25030 [Chloroflexi bacterium]|nr:hypothetical protein [Chloroflexota bacterium]